MAASAAFLFEKRKELLDELNAALNDTCRALSGEMALAQYSPSQPLQQHLPGSYLAQLQKNRQVRKSNLGSP